MLAIFATILIHSAPLDEIPEKTLMVNATKETEFSLKGGKTIQVKQFEFSGNNAIPTAQLKRLTAPYLNVPVSNTTLSVIKEKISSFYKNRGYSQVKVSIPAKQKEGSLSLVIKEGKKTK